MRIAVCAYDNPAALSGPASWFQRVPLALAERGHEVSAHIFWWHDELSGRLRQYAAEAGINAIGHRFLDSESNVRSLLRGLQHIPPDVLIADNVVPALMANAYMKRVGIQTVGVLRSDDTFYHALIDRFAASNDEFRVNSWVAVSEYLGSEIRQRSNGSCRCCVIPSGAPMPRSTAAWTPGRFRLVYAGRLVQEQKRILDTTRCMIRICRSIPGLECTIAGDGPERSTVEAMIADSGVNIEVAGYRGENELRELLLNSHALLLLSDYEGTPTVVMEAMACGVVPICLNLRSGIPELVIPNRTGLVVHDRDDEVLKQVTWLHQNPVAWSQLSTAAREHVATGFSTNVCVEKWDAFLNDLVSESPGREALAVPERIQLPRPHPGFAFQDTRPPGLIDRILSKGRKHVQKTRFIAGKIRRKLFSNE